MRLLRVALTVSAIVASVTVTEAQALRGAWEAGKWILKGRSVTKVVPGAAAKSATVTSKAAEVTASSKSAQAAADAKSASAPTDWRETRDHAISHGGKAYHEYCNSDDKRYDTQNCAAYKGARETARMPREPKYDKRK